jgi:predicted phosphodiesterase
VVDRGVAAQAVPETKVNVDEGRLMRIGILADIHEDAANLALALQRFRQEAVQKVVLLGDVVFEMGSRLHQTIALLAEARAVGVWGNHDLGLCHEPDEGFKERYAGPVFDFMQTLRPRLELEGCLFTHGLPYYDATDPVVYYLGERPETTEGLAKSFAASNHPILFVGHFHRWLVASPQGLVPWDGAEPIRLRLDERYLVVVAAVCNGWCAVFDTDSREMVPFHLPGATAAGSGSPVP